MAKPPSSNSENEWSDIDKRAAVSATINGPKVQLPKGAEQQARKMAAAVGAKAAEVGLQAGVATCQIGRAAGAVGMNVAGLVGRAAVTGIRAQIESRMYPDAQPPRRPDTKRPEAEPSWHPTGVHSPRFMYSRPPQPAKKYPEGLSHIRNLGYGGQANVELWGGAVGGKIFAAKIFKVESSYAAHSSKIEHHILTNLKKHNPNANIVNVVGPLLTDTPKRHHFTLLLEYCDLGDLADYKQAANRREQAVSEEFIWNVFSQISSALAYLHTGLGSENYRKNNEAWIPIVHRDMKPANILIKSRNGSKMPIMKLSDFGLAIYKDENFTSRTGICGTAAFHPPAPKGRIDTPADVWALGAIVHWLCTGEIPNDEFQSPWLNARNDEHRYQSNLPRRVLDIRQSRHQHKPLSKRLNCTRHWVIPYSDALHADLMPAMHFNSSLRIGAADLHKSIQKTLADLETKMIADGSIVAAEEYRDLFNALKEVTNDPATESSQDSEPMSDNDDEDGLIEDLEAATHDLRELANKHAKDKAEKDEKGKAPEVQEIPDVFNQPDDSSVSH
jgi:serine/threonine protein kinase